MSTYRYRIRKIEDITRPERIGGHKRFYLEAQIIGDQQVMPWELKIAITCSRTRLAEWGVFSQEENKLFYFCGEKFLKAKIAAGEIEETPHDLDLDKEYGRDPPCDLNEVLMELDAWSGSIGVKRRIGF